MVVVEVVVGDMVLMVVAMAGRWCGGVIVFLGHFCLKKKQVCLGLKKLYKEHDCKVFILGNYGRMPQNFSGITP